MALINRAIGCVDTQSAAERYRLEHDDGSVCIYLILTFFYESFANEFTRINKHQPAIQSSNENTFTYSVIIIFPKSSEIGF